VRRRGRPDAKPWPTVAVGVFPAVIISASCRSVLVRSAACELALRGKKLERDLRLLRL
jgi:hypothetical protein